jgi:hypothetical protein
MIQQTVGATTAAGAPSRPRPTGERAGHGAAVLVAGRRQAMVLVPHHARARQRRLAASASRSLTRWRYEGRPKARGLPLCVRKKERARTGSPSWTARVARRRERPAVAGAHLQSCRAAATVASAPFLFVLGMVLLGGWSSVAQERQDTGGGWCRVRVIG